MKLDFTKPAVPNFIATLQGTFAVADLSKEDLEEFIAIWANTIRGKHAKKSIKDSK